MTSSSGRLRPGSKVWSPTWWHHDGKLLQLSRWSSLWSSVPFQQPLMVPGATIFVLPNALFAEVRHMNICPVVLQNETRLHKIICSCQVRIVAEVCHFLEVSRVCGFLLHFIQLSMWVDCVLLWSNVSLVSSTACFYTIVTSVKLLLAVSICFTCCVLLRVNGD
jgi:hypothetical protein